MYELINPQKHVRSAMITKITDSHYVLFVTTCFTSNVTDYVAKSLTGAKIVFSKYYFSGSKWAYSKDPE